VRNARLARQSVSWRHAAVITGASLLLALASCVACWRCASAAPQNLGVTKGQVIGVEFDARMVSNLEKSVAFYKLLGFSEVPGVDPSWRVDEVFNQIYGTKGVESRMAKLTMNTNFGKQTPFTLYLREFRGIARRNVMQGKQPWEPGASHICVTVPDAGELWSKLKAAGMLWPRSWDGKLIPLPGQTKGTIAYTTDPDGMDIEVIEQRPAASAADGQPARPGEPPGFNHVGLVILDSDKIRGFYGALLGEQFPAAPAPWINSDFTDSAVGGHGNIIRLVMGTFPLALDPGARMRFEIVEYENRKKPVEPYGITDSGVNCLGFEVSDIDALVARLNGAGIPLVSSGIATMRTGYRVALVRDPDVGMFVELFERPKS
jgi:catechol 2,3-dioxygenase-like lactoylglutathione lyase family enzyme